MSLIELVTYRSGQFKFELKMPQLRKLLLRANFKHTQAASLSSTLPFWQSAKQ